MNPPPSFDKSNILPDPSPDIPLVYPPDGRRPAPRLIGFAGWSGAGKTTLITKLIPQFKARGLSVSTLKHAHHGFDMDRPGKDSFAHREAGAKEVLIASSNRWALLHEIREEPEMSLAGLLRKLAPVDLVIIEGFKAAPYPKIEVFREINAKPYLFPNDPNIVALASDAAIPAARIPILDLNNIIEIADQVLGSAIDLDLSIARLERL